MCGIAGYAGDFRAGLAVKMNAAQAHRGPDGAGIFEDPVTGVMLAHVRLAILDLSPAGAQPMHSPDGRWVLTYNGEIYNYRELRSELEKKGEKFRSTGDTEVLLRGLARYGHEFLDRLNGIFAIGLWDRYERTLLLARDPLGIKPLYYTEPEPRTLLFASEIKALTAHPGLRREPDFTAITQHLAFSHACGSRTAFQEVHRLQPGHYLTYRSCRQHVQIRRFWPRGTDGAGSPFQHLHDPNLCGNGLIGVTDKCSPSASRKDEAAAWLREMLHEAVARQMISDVPVGAFFSGGVDSSAVVKTALAENPVMKGYLVSYPPEENRLDAYVDDAPYARELACLWHLTLDEQEIKPQIVDLWPKLIWHLDEPLADPAAIACYLISRRAREDGTIVLLNGQGGDELFGGYPRYQVMAKMGVVDHFPKSFRKAISTFAQTALPGAIAGKWGASARRVRRVLAEVSRKPAERFLAYCANVPQSALVGCLGPAFHENESAPDPFAEDLAMMKSSGRTGLDSFLLRDMLVYLPNHNLNYTDKISMACGVEVRVPLLDMKIVNTVLTWPAAWNIRYGQTKALFRRATRGLLPNSIVNRPKAGFGAPYRKWLREDLDELWNDVMNDTSVRRRGWFDPVALQKARTLSMQGKEDLYMLQWCALTIELWAREFIDNNPYQCVKS